MTVTLVPNHTAQLFIGTVVAVPQPISFDNSVPATPLTPVYGWDLSPNTYFISNLTLTAHLSNVIGSGDIYFVIASQPFLYLSFPNGPQFAVDLPTVISPTFGLADSFEVGRVTANAPKDISIDLDLVAITQFMSSNIRPSIYGQWNGTLVIWMGSTTGITGTLENLQLSTLGVVDGRNRDTGRSGAPVGSRVDRCPVSGFALSRQRMVRDGWRGIYVHPLVWDPEWPTDREWVDYPDPNEDG